MPVAQFCVWTAEPDPAAKRKRKVWFGHSDEPVFASAGIWRPGDESPYMSFLTCEPNETVGAIHPKAMPVMLDRDSFSRWLDDDHLSACELAGPMPMRK